MKKHTYLALGAVATLSAIFFLAPQFIGRPSFGLFIFEAICLYGGVSLFTRKPDINASRHFKNWGRKDIESVDVSKKEEIVAILNSLDELSKQRNIDRDIRKHLNPVIDNIKMALTSKSLHTGGMMEFYFAIKNIATKYLIQALETYVNMPDFARNNNADAEKNPKEILIRQLNTIDSELKEILALLAEKDTEKMIIHEKFLNDKFKNSSFFEVGK